MDTKDLKGLMEAYSEVYAPQEVDEAIYSEKGKAKAAEMIAKRSTPSGRAKPGKGANVAHIRQIRGSGRGDFDREGLGGTPMTPTMAKNPIKKQNYTGTGNKAARRAGLTPTREKPNAWKEELDIFDVVLEFLQAEGYAETLEEAEWMMANLIDEEAISIILEAMDEEDDEEEMKKGKKSKKEEDDEEDDDEDDDEDEEDLDEGVSGDVAARAQKLANQKKNQTPERKKMYQGLADRAAERERGPFRRGTSRQGMTPAERTRSRQAAAYQADVHGGSATYGKGSLPKGKKLERQKARGVSERFEAWLDEALTGERYRKVMKKPGGTAYSRKVSADPAKRATRGGRGGESDFGAGDRGSGNKAARRAGTYKEYNVNEAQHARENPEKYEREQAKKSAPVRGERTPMPPRGDKRREEFEKWYAKQMGR